MSLGGLAERRGCDNRSVSDTITLWRPVGPKELALIEAADWRAFPPRLPGQPIFYPVLNEGYATQIARDWNATSAETGYRGYVTCFQVRRDFLAAYEVHVVGGSEHREYWVPAEELLAFNAAIVGQIEVVRAFRGAAGSAPIEVDPSSAVETP